jgi:dihydroorotate dehydrogenase electron transfer subunit
MTENRTRYSEKAPLPVIEQNVNIAFNRRVAADVFLIVFRSAEMARAARPGQFVMIRVGAGMDPLLRRPFSICGARDQRIYVLYRAVGRGTRMLSEIREDASLAVLGPLGNGFDLPPSGRPSILTAGGMGIAPLLFLAGSMAPHHYTFLAGFGSADQIIGPDQMGLSGIKMLIATDDGSAGRHGLVTELLKASLAGGNRAGGVFACGPLPMLKAVAAITQDNDIPCQVSLETTMACGLGACQGCAVKAAPGQDQAYWHVCQDGPVFDRTDVDWEAL